MFDFEKLKDHPELLDNVDKGLKSNKEFVLECVSVNPLCIKYIDVSLHRDYDIAKTVIINDPTAYTYLQNDEIRKDKEIAKIVLLIDGLSLRYLTEELRDDEELVAIAMSQNPMCFIFASGRIKFFHFEGLDKTKLHIHLDKKGFYTFRLPTGKMSSTQEELFKNLHILENPSWFLSLVFWIEFKFNQLLNFFQKN